MKSWQEQTWIASSLQSLSSFNQGEKGNKLPQQLQRSNTLATSTQLVLNMAARSCGCVQEDLAWLCRERDITPKQTNIRLGGGVQKKKLLPPPPPLQNAWLSIISVLWQWSGSQLAGAFNNKQTQHCLAWANNLQFPQSQPSLPSDDEYSLSLAVVFFCWLRRVFWLQGRILIKLEQDFLHCIMWLSLSGVWGMLWAWI